MQLSFFPQLRAHLTRDEIIAPPPRKKKAAITVPIYPLSPDQTERGRPIRRGSIAGFRPLSPSGLGPPSASLFEKVRKSHCTYIHYRCLFNYPDSRHIIPSIQRWRGRPSSWRRRPCCSPPAGQSPDSWWVEYSTSIVLSLSTYR